MITIITDESKDISQDFYDTAIEAIPLYSLICSCGHAGCLIGHGTYIRHVKTDAGKIALVVRRVCCTICSATHAILPSALVPYSQVSLRDHVAIASSFERGSNGMEVLENNPELSPSQVWYILSLYIRCWRQCLLNEHICFYPIHALTQSCVVLFSRQFMQIKATKNILFPPLT